MNAVKNNPYRTLGLFGNSSEKELQKQIATIKRFTEVGKSKSFDYDFPFLGEVVRDSSVIQEAASRIEQARNKVHYALFWFLNNGHIDELALNNLKEGNVEKAEEIWEKTLKDLTINNKNFSAASNLSTLLLAEVTYNGSFDPEKFLSSIEIKGKLLTSNSINDFITTVAGQEISINHDAILKEFVDEILSLMNPYIIKPLQKQGVISGVTDNGIGIYGWENGSFYFGEFKDGKRSGLGMYLWQDGSFYYGDFKSNAREGDGVYVFPNGSRLVGKWINGQYQNNENNFDSSYAKAVKRRIMELAQQSGISFNYITPVQIINAFRNFPAEIRQYVGGKFSDKPLSSIENAIENTRQKRKNNPAEAFKFGEELFSKNKPNIDLLKGILGDSNVQFQMITNKFAQEILQCSIDYFNELSDSNDIDPGDQALKLLKSAKSVNPTGQVKSRIDENEEVIQEWVNNKPERVKNDKVKTDIEYIGTKLERFKSLPDTLVNAKDLINSCKPRLQNIKNILGPSDDFYLKLSSAVVHNGLNAIISVVNEEQELVQYDQTRLAILFTTISESIQFLSLMAEMDMDYELRGRFNQNRSTITNIQSSIKQYVTSHSRTQSKNSGCYIATMVYGSYDHPQVMVLRNYRDNVLSRSFLGARFIQFYYRYSPILVEKFKGKPIISKIIKTILNIFIQVIK